MARRAKVQRKTNETAIELALDLDGSGERRIATPVPFFNHMLDAFARHGLFDLEVKATGDVEVDAHHTVEDVGHLPGQAFREALGDRAGITRYGEATIPMDETLVPAAVDFCGRAGVRVRADALEGKSGRRPSTASWRRSSSAASSTAPVQPAPRGALRRERAPHDRGAVQGVRAGDRRGGAARPARRRACRRPRVRSPRERRAAVVDRRPGKRQPAQRREGAGRARAPTRRRQRRRRRGRARRQARRPRPGRVRRLRRRARPRRRRARPGGARA